MGEAEWIERLQEENEYADVLALNYLTNMVAVVRAADALMRDVVTTYSEDGIGCTFCAVCEDAINHEADCLVPALLDALAALRSQVEGSEFVGGDAGTQSVLPLGIS